MYGTREELHTEVRDCIDLSTNAAVARKVTSQYTLDEFIIGV